MVSQSFPHERTGSSVVQPRAIFPRPGNPVFNPHADSNQEGVAQRVGRSFSSSVMPEERCFQRANFSCLTLGQVTWVKSDVVDVLSLGVLMVFGLRKFATTGKDVGASRDWDVCGLDRVRGK